MNRRTFLKPSAAVTGTLGLNLPSRAQSESKPPNLVFVFPDQMRGSAMGFLNEEPVITPNHDSFSRESLVLTQAASNYPVCSPYRAMLMSGKYPHATGVLHDNVKDPFQMQNIVETDSLKVNDLIQTELKPWLEKTRDRREGAGVARAIQSP